MKFYDEDKICWADIIFWLFCLGAIAGALYGVTIWFQDAITKY